MLPFLLTLPLLYNVQGVFGGKIYKVAAKRDSADPLISKSAGADPDFNYNAALFPMEGADNQLGCIVRSQNLNQTGVPFIVGQSFLTASKITFDTNGKPTATPPGGVVFPADTEAESCGTEDPRIAIRDGIYYMTYTAYDCDKAMLSTATSSDPLDPLSWDKLGFSLPDLPWSKSGAILFSSAENKLKQHYMFWGDSSTPVGGIGIITSTDGRSWRDNNAYLMKIRNDTFDSELVESGPSPFQLKSGDYLFIYNSARRGVPSIKPGWVLEYNVGFAILDAADPTVVVQRSDSPIMSPELDWEIGNTTEFLTPNVVFLEGMVPDPFGCTTITNMNELIGEEYVENAECFFAVYGGADSVLGSVRIVSSWIEVDETTEVVVDTATTTTKANVRATTAADSNTSGAASRQATTLITVIFAVVCCWHILYG